MDESVRLGGAFGAKPWVCSIARRTVGWWFSLFKKYESLLLCDICVQKYAETTNWVIISFAMGCLMWSRTNMQPANLLRSARQASVDINVALPVRC